MKHKLIDISEVVQMPSPCELTLEEEAAIIAQYKTERTPEALEADYKDIDKQMAESVPAEQLLRKLGIEFPAE